MVHYIRFLKLPRAERRKADVLIKALITITTDLGDAFFDGSVVLTASLRGTDFESVYLGKNYTWNAPKRALNIELLWRNGDTVPAWLHVGVENSEGSDYIGSDHIPAITSLWAAIVTPSSQECRTDLVQRRLKLHDSGILVIWEESGESIARHIW